jgi:prepilin-type N-terminal cleavage/methylation domain-containing protein
MMIKIKLNKTQSSGFTLPEMLISISLGLFLSILLIKIYLWQAELHHEMDDMIFLDHNSFLALEMLGHEIREADYITISKQGAVIDFSYKDYKDSYYIQENELYRSRKIPKKSDDNIGLISGVTKFHAIQKGKSVTVTLNLIAPNKMTEIISRTFELENEKS